VKLHLKKNSPADTNGVINTVLNWAATITGWICKYKKKIYDYFTKRLLLFKNNKKLKRRFFRRSFMERRRRGFMDWVNQIKANVTAALSWAADKIASAAQAIGGFLVEKKAQLVAALTAWLGEPMIKKILDFVNCAGGLAAALKTAVAKVKGIAELVSGIVSGNPISIGKVIVNLICEWKQLFDAGAGFVAAFKTSNVLERYYNVGKSVGTIFSVIGDLASWRRRRLHHRRK